MDQARRFRGPPLYSVLWTVPAGLLSKLGFQFFMFAIELRAPGARSCILFELPALPIGLALSIIPYWALCDLTDLAAISTRPGKWDGWGARASVYDFIHAARRAGWCVSLNGRDPVRNSAAFASSTGSERAQRQLLFSSAPRLCSWGLGRHLCAADVNGH